jgi:hypothetical protein
VNAGDPGNLRPSEAAAKRRDAILADALRAADRRRHRLVARRVTGVAGICLLAAGAFSVVSRSVRAPERPGTLGHVAPAPTSSPAFAPTPVPTPAPVTNPGSSPIVVQIIPADRVERTWQVINDDQLIAAMAAAGKPGGVARLNGRAVVVPLQ